MRHSIFTGPFEALEPRWAEAVAELQTKDPLSQVNVLVGSNILASYLKRRLAARGRTVANIRFQTFLDLVTRLASASKTAPGKPRLPRLGASIILEGILRSGAPEVYRDLSGCAGFRDALLDTFRDLRDAGISPGEFDSAIEANNLNPDRRESLSALSNLYRRFRETVRGFHDVDDDFRSAIGAASDAARILGSGRLLVYGIYDATGQQADLLAALKDSLELIYFIPFVDPHVSDFARPFLEARVRELGVGPSPVDAEKSPCGLGSLAERGFGFIDAKPTADAGGLAADGSFALVSAPGESRAAVEIVREIFRAVEDGTIRDFREAAVILRQPEGEIPIVTEMFRLRGVPYFLHGGDRFADRPFSRAVAALSELEPAGFPRGAVLAAMELVAASLPENRASSWDVQRWRALTNDPRFTAGLRAWDAGVEGLVAQTSGELHRAETRGAESLEEEDLDRGAESVRKANKRLEAAKSLREGWRCLRQAAADWPEALSWKEWARFLESRLQPLLGPSEDWNPFSSVLDEIAGLEALSAVGDSGQGPSNGKQIPADRLRAVLRESIASLSVPAGRFGSGGVTILSTGAARGLRFPLVVIPGLDEGRFPAKLRQDPLLLDSERRWLKNMPLKSMRAEEEKLLFDMAARSAEKRLVLMTSRLEEGSDRESIPSQFFLRAAAAVAGRTLSIRDLNEETVAGFRSVSLDSPAPGKGDVAVDEGEIRLRMITSERRSAHAALKALAQLEPQRLSRPMAYDRARWNRELTEFDGYLTDAALVRHAAQKMGAASGQVSASRLEEYAKCPYFFFLKRIVELEAWEEPERAEGMDPLERGLVVHSVLEGFLADYRGGPFPDESLEDLWSSLESQAVKKLEAARPVGMPDLLWDVERDALLATLRNWLEFEKGRAGPDILISQLERGFGEMDPGERLPAFRLQAGRHAFEFRGRIDRVDVSRDGRTARVIDYKCGTLPYTMTSRGRAPLMSGERIQIAVYKGALSTMDELRNVEAVEGEYLYLQPRDAQTAPCSYAHEELLKASAALPRVLEIMGDCLESGVFFARTSGTVRPYGHCDFCDYLPVCGKDRVQREERKAGAPAVQRFMQILEIA
jgi:RecB family exonuclease